MSPDPCCFWQNWTRNEMEGKHWNPWPTKNNKASGTDNTNTHWFLAYLTMPFQLHYGRILHRKIIGNGVQMSIRRSQWPRGLRRGSAATRFLGLWVRMPGGHGYLFLASVVCCQVGVSDSGWSLVQRSPTECGTSKMRVIAKPRKRRPWPEYGPTGHRKQNEYL
jgi:hypothetical protein